MYGIETDTVDAGASVLATYNGSPAVVVGHPGQGRSVFLAPYYTNSSSELGYGDADRLVEQAVAWAAGSRVDRYQFQGVAGDTVQIYTLTPGDGVGQPVNDLNPAITLYDANGNPLTNNADGYDGRNALLVFTLPETGAYTVEVSAEAGTGEYQLRVNNDHFGSGGMPVAPAFEVTSSQPVADGSVPTYPATYRVTLSEQVLLTSVDAGDLSVNGMLADSVTVVDGNTLEFTIANADNGEALYSVEIADGALISLSGQNIMAYSATFNTDYTPPTVIDSSLAQYSVVATDPQTLEFTFSEALNLVGLGVDDVELQDSNGNLHAITSFSYDGLSHVLSIGVPGLTEGDYSLRLRSGNGAFEDLVGNDLDGDGVAGSDYVFHFTVDITTTSYPTPLAAIQPDGSLIYDPAPNGIFHAEGDSDDYVLLLEAGQVLTVSLNTNDAGLLGHITLLDINGLDVLGEASASGYGMDAVLQTVSLANTGVYTLRVSAEGGQGSYQVQALLNSAREIEARGQSGGNEIQSDAQNIDASFIDIDGSAGNTSRGAVRGELVGDEDWYRFSLQAGETSTITLSRDNQAASGNMTLALYNESGGLIATGNTDSTTLDSYIKDFTTQTGGNFYVRVAGDASVYSLLATRNADFDLELATQDISLTQTVIGYVGGSGSGGTGTGASGSINLSTNLYDASGYLWDIRRDGNISNGIYDAYDGGMVNTVFPQFSTAQTEENGREIVIGTANIGSVEVTRKIYVPADQSFARFLEIVHNPGTSTINHTVPIYTNLGSDGYEPFVMSSSGDSSVTTSDNWVVTDDTPSGQGSGTASSPTSDPVVTHVVAGDGGRLRPASFSHSSGSINYSYNLTLAPGETQIIMHFAGQAGNQPSAVAHAEQLANLELDALYGMSAAERNAVVNFAVGDADSYTFVANLGDPLVIETFTPGDGVGEPDNNVDVGVTLYAPDGSLISSANYTETSPDDRNAHIEYTAAVGGFYRVEVRAENQTNGAYLLKVSGSTANLDHTPPVVISSSLHNGDIVAPGNLSYTATFSEELASGGLGFEDVVLTNIDTGGVIALTSNQLNYDPVTSTLTANFSNLAEGNYSLALLASVNGFRDTQDNLLDGNADGFGGDNYVVSFRVDAVGATPLQTLQAIAPAGSLVFDPAASGSLFGVGDADDFTIALDAGQKASVRVTPAVAGLQAQVQLIGPDGATVLGTASAISGQTVLLQNVNVASVGTYTVRITSLAGSGAYETQLVLNAQLESEAWGGSSNSSQANAENIDASAVALVGSADRLAVLGTVSGGNDWYRFSLNVGQAASLAVTRTDNPALTGLNMQLYDASGNLLASGIPDAGNVDQSISSFVASAAGVYYARISSASVMPYCLVVTRSADFGLETTGQVQDISVSGQVLGAIGSSGHGGGGLIRVAVLQGSYNSSVLGWLNDNTYFNFNASLVSAASIDTVAELNNYDVVLIGDQSTHSALTTIAPALRQWVEAGGGVVGAGWLTYAAGSATGTPITDIDAIIPVDTSSYYQYQYNPLIDITNATHPVTSGVADFYPGTYSNDTVAADVWGTVLASANGRPSVVVGQPGNGHSVYLSPIYNDSPSSLASGFADRLLEQAVAWAAGDNSDSYTFQATAGQVLTITTTTLGDGIGEPVNGLDARLELYDSIGALVTSDDNGAVDGRNARILYTPITSGVYEIRVIGVGANSVTGRGDYILKVDGANLDPAVNAAPLVVATNPTEGQNFIAPPATITLTLSEVLLATSVQASDLVLNNGASATGVQFVDGRTVRFTLSTPNTEGSFNYSLAAGAVSDLQGVANSAYAGSFHVDHTGPRVAAESPDSNAPFNSIDLTFNEAIDPSTVSTSDIASFTGPGGANLLSQISSVSVVNGNILRVSFGNQYAEGDYTLVLSPTLTDLVGNAMNQDGDINNGEATDDRYTAVVHVNSVDLIAPVVTAPSSANFGQQITVSWVGHNNLSAPATAGWYDYVVLSSDAILDGSDNYIAYNYPGAQPLAGHADYSGSATFNLPLNQSLLDGTYYLFVVSDQGNYQAEADNNNNVSTAVPIQLSYGNHPDLTVTGLDVTATPKMESSASVTVSWNTMNAGNGVMNGYFYDRVNVFNVTTNTNLGDWDYWYDGRSPANNIAVGGSIARTATIKLPDGPSAVGDLRFTVTTDVYNYVFERTMAGANGENNNSISITRASTLASYSDLQVDSLSVTPSNPETGSTLHIVWTDGNYGTNATEANFYDRVKVVNTTTNTTLLDTWQLYNGAAIGVGGTVDRAYDFRIPDGPTGVGALKVTITTDVNNNVYEYLVGQSAEANNDKFTTVTSTLAMYPDLHVANLTVTPTSPQSSEQMTINWDDVNSGNLASAGYSNLIRVHNNTTNVDHVYTAVAVGGVAAGGSAARSYSFTLPDGNAGTGSLTITISNDYNSQVFEYNVGGTAETNNSASTNATSIIAPYPDLVVQNLAVTSASGLQSGGVMHIAWSDVNTGTLSADASWNDRIVVVNTRTGATLLNTTVLHNAGADGSVAASGSLARSYDFTLPDGSAGVGDIQVTVSADTYSQQYEYNPGGTGESNNSTSATVTTTIALYADLQVQDLAVTPNSLQSGSVMHITWNDANTGGLAASASWYDLVVVTKVSDSGILLNTTVYHDHTTQGSVAAGGSLARAYDFALPNGDAGVGDFQVTVTTDVYGYQYEHNGNGIDPSTAESNNSASTTVSSTIASYADLQVQNLTVTPSTLLTGGVMAITWNDANTGLLAAGSNWYDHLVVVNTSTGATLLDTVLYHSSASEGSVAAGGSLARSYNFTLPNGNAGVGNLSITVIADVYGHQYEYNAGGTAESNNSGSTTASATISPYADVQVQNLTVTPSTLFSGGVMAITWNDANTGLAAAGSNWYDHIVVVNTSTGASLLDTILYHNAASEGSVAVGGSLARGYNFTVPNGNAGVGNLFITVTTDVYGAQYEYNAGGTAESNNTAATSAASNIANYADLKVRNLSLTPSILQSGDSVTLNWETYNQGSAATASSFYDRVTVVNQTTGETLVNSWVYYDQASGGSLGVGDARVRSYNFNLPQGTRGAGNLLITVDGDIGNYVYEYNAASTGETNNSATMTADSSLAPYPNLTLSDIIAPINGLSGRAVQLSWVVTNTGDGPLSGTWTDQVSLSGDDAAGGDTWLANFSYSGNNLNPGQSVTRTEQLTLPNFITGDRWFVVRTDIGGAVFELNEVDNIVADTAAINVGAALSFSITPTSVGESAGASAATATITRSGDTSSALTVNLSSNLADVTLPASVVIPVGQSSLSFGVGVVDNNLVDGNRTAVLTAAAGGFADGGDSLTIIDNDVPSLILSATPTIIDEGYGPLTITVTRNTNTTEALTVNLNNSRPNKLVVPTSVEIAAGASSATFQVMPVNDTEAEGNRTVDISGNSLGFASGGLRLQILDNDIPTLSMELSNPVVTEGVGVGTTHGTLTRSIVTDSVVRVGLTGDIGRVRVPGYIAFQAGQASVDFDITVLDNNLADGDHLITIGASVVDQFSSVPLAGTRVEKSLQITDNDGPTLTLTIDKNVLAEAAGANAAIVTVTRNTPADTDLTVFLSSTDATEATVTDSVVIHAGQQSASFAVNAVQDGIQDGTQSVTLIAAAQDFNSGSVGLQVTDRELPDLQVNRVLLPTAAMTGSTIQLSWTVNNAGLGAAGSSWVDSVYFSSDSVLSADDQLLGSYPGDTPLANGTTYTKTVNVALGTRVGELWAFVVTDSGGSVTEIAEGNNVRSASVLVTPSYAATVSTDVIQAPEGTVIPMTGAVHDITTGEPKPFSLVAVKVTTGGTVRTIDAVSDRDGNFSAKFTPLPGEAGHYTISAVFPGVTDYTSQDSFDILGMKATGGINAALLPGQTQTGQIEVRNLSPIALTHLAVSIANLPPSVTVTFDVPDSLPGSGSVLIGYTVTAAVDATALNGSAPIVITSDEGISTSATLSLSVTPLTPHLVANPGYLVSGMLRGAQNSVSFDITNTGGAATGLLQVQLPADTEWLSLSSSKDIASLAPGEKTTVTLLLNPGADLSLQRYDGSINVVSNNSYVTVPFQFRAVSEAVGDVKITVTDEYTYFAEDKPNLANATVQLLDVYTYQVVASAVTDASGIVSFTGIAEGAYTLNVTAAQHDSFRSSIQVTPGGLVDEEVFLHRQAVTYNWTVVPTEVQDHYKIVLESTFVTEVPMPVVTVDDPFIMPWIIPGYETQFNITLRNHGLINAEHVQIQVPNDPDYVITPLVGEIPVLAAKSEVTIPVTIRLSELGMSKLNASSGDVQSVGAISALTKCLGLGVVYTYQCKDGVWQQVPIQLAATIGCAEGIGDAAKSIPEYLAEKSGGNLLGAGCDVISLALDCYTAATGGEPLTDCQTAMLTTACKAAAGFLVGGPAGAAGGAASNWADILACLCSLDWGIGGGTTGGGSPGGGGGWSWGGYGGGPGSPYTTPVGYSTTKSGCSPTSSGSDVISSGDTSLVSQAGGVCAEVRLRLEQEAVITRTAFLGTLEINNGRSDTILQDVQLTLDIRDANGNSANDMFVVRGPTLTDVVLDANGKWTINPSSTGMIQYTFVPTNDAAPDAPVIYSMGGTLHYVDNGTTVDVPLLPARITVFPEAKLNLNYFWQRDVYADDPFTDVVEPSEPFALGLQVTNVGKGGAGDLTITSAQPEIVENEKGLLVDFKIISSQVGANPGTSSLTVDLGNIAPAETKTAQWNMISSLQGKFKDFSATFEHLDDNGDLRTSLIQQVNIHELIRSVRLTTPTEDGIPDYLVNDVPDPDNLPDVLYMSTGGQAQVTLATEAQISSGGLTRNLSANMQSGWSYIQVADALPGYELTKVVRSDGKALPIDGMAWRTNRTFHAGEPGATYENLFHLLDFDSTGSYTLTYAIVDHVSPTLQSVGGVAAGLQITPVDAIELTFSELIDDTTLSAADFSLQLNGAAVVVPGLTVTYLNGNTWRVSGLAGASAADGNYRLVVDAHGITDLGGNVGTNSVAIDWAMGASASVILDVQAVSPSLRHDVVNSLDVIFSRGMDAASFDWSDLALTLDGSAVALNDSVSVVQLDATTFRVNGLADFTSVAGNYALTVLAEATSDSVGVSGVGQFTRTWTLDTTAPTFTGIEHLSTNPRNIVVMSLDVDFSESIDPFSFDWRDISLTRDGGSNLITNEVTVEQVDADTWRIKGFNCKVGQNGEYVLTVNGAGISDLAGNNGLGSVSETWSMDIVDPIAPTNLVIGPDNGISHSDGLTNTLNLNLTGELPEIGLAVRLTDLTNNKELGYATVTDTGFSGNFTLSGPGNHHIRVRVADAAGNLAPDSFVDVFVDTTAPGVASIVSISPNPRTTGVDTVNVTLDEAVDQDGFTFQDISLTLDGSAVSLNNTVTIGLVSGNTYRIAGLGGFTTAPGAYQLTVSAVGLTDLAGNTGNGAKSITWTTLNVLPTGIRGFVYADLDGSGTYNPASYNPESAIAGRTVFLDANGNGVLDDGEQSTTSSADGSYAFDSLVANNYRVAQVLPTGWILTGSSAAGYNVTLVDGHTVSGADFGNFQTGSIQGVKFNDLDADGTRDPGESVLAGWTIFLDTNANGILDGGETSVVTGTDGAFSFSNIGSDTVQIAEVMQDGWQRTTPEVAYRIKSGFAVTDDVGNVLLGSIGGAKFNDLNGNGVRDVGEPGIQGWTIFIDGNANGVLDGSETSTLTDANGNYSFTSLLPGQYTLAEVQRAGWTQTSPLPSTVGVGVTTADSNIVMESDCACGAQWATSTSASLVDYGALSIQTALSTVGITDLRSQPGYANLDGRGVTTVVIDTGIDLDHSFFGSDFNGDGVDDRIIYQYDFANGDTNASDVNGHGSHIASVIGSQDSRYTGVAPGTDIIALKVFEDSGRGYFSYLEKALQWVLANHEAYHVGVVNLSLGDAGNWTDDFSRYGIGDELAALSQTDVIVIAAAGNNYLQFGRMGVAYPASDPAAIAVGATWSADFGGPWTVSTGATSYSTGIDQIAAFSQRDTQLLDTFAPGARFNGANAKGGITTMQGTSQAAAFVSGSAALAQQIAHEILGRGLTTGEFATLLRETDYSINDGDNEIDNVVNTGLNFGRMDFEKLAARIASLGAAPAEGNISNGTGGDAGLVQQAAAGVHTVQLVAGNTATGYDFGNFHLVNIAGKVFSDGNGNGSVDGTETGLEGWTVFIDTNHNDSLDAGESSAITDISGAYSFADMSPGSHRITVQNSVGYQLTTATFIDVVTQSGVDSVGENFGAHLIPVNDAPLATADSYAVDEDGVLNVAASNGVLNNDSDMDGDSLHTVLVSNAAHGNVILNANGGFSYTPNANYNGSDSFTYQANDGSLDSNVATVTLTVNAVNDAPLATADSYAVDEDSVLNVAASNGVLNNDSDMDGDSLHTVLVSNAAHGNVILNANGGFSYTPNANYNGSDSFTYQANDGSLDSNVATVTLKVNAVNDAPLATADSYAVDEDSVLNVAASNGVLNNDSDMDGDSLHTVLVSNAAHGNVILNANGGFSYTPNANYNGSDSFTYQANDGSLDSNVATVTLTVNAVLPDYLSVNSLTQTATGFNVRFDHAFDPSVINLYDAADTPRGSADVTLTGSNGAVVKGSLVMDADYTGFTFIKTGGLLSVDNYSVTLASGGNAFHDGVGALDGNNDGIAGDAYRGNFIVGVANPVTLSIADFMRGPGQAVNVPASGAGLPIILNSAGGVRKLSFTLDYDPSKLSIIDVALVSGLPTGTTLASDLSTLGHLSITVNAPVDLASGKVNLVKLTAQIPDGAGYGSKELLNLGNLLVNDGALAATDDDGLHLVGYFGDASGNADYNSLDTQRVQRVISKLDSGFSAYANADPVIVADINGDGALNSVDASRIQNRVLGRTDPAIPVRPNLPSITFSGPDPKVWVEVGSTMGKVVSAAIKLDTAEDLESVKLKLVYDAEFLQVVSIRRGDLTSDFAWYIDKSQPGIIDIDMSRLDRMEGGTGDLLLVDFLIKDNANGTLHLDLVDAWLNEGRLTLNTQPKLDFDATDADILVQAASISTLQGVGQANESSNILDSQRLPIIDLNRFWSGGEISSGVDLISDDVSVSKNKAVTKRADTWRKAFLTSQSKRFENNPNAKIRIEL